MHDNLDLIFKSDGILKSIKKDYIPRPSQIEAAHKIHSALNLREHFILEGPCGFGKTFSYLTPLFEYLHSCYAENFKAVIVTNGISLQEQLFHKDIPLVQKIFKSMYSRELKYTMLKGRQNYTCMQKMGTVLSQSGFNAKCSKELEDKMLKWYKETKTGDLSELDFVPESKLLNEMAALKDDECKGRKCSIFADCFYQKHKVKAQLSDIIITNYHMLFTDLDIGNNIILPKYDIIIFDEAHETASIFRDFNSRKMSLNSIKILSRDYTEAYNIYNDYLATDSKNEFVVKAKSLFTDLLQECEKYFEEFFDLNFKDNKYQELKVVNENIIIKYPDKEVVSKILSDINTLMSHIIMLNAEMFEFDKDNEYLQKYDKKINSIWLRITEFLDVMKFEISNDIVSWVEKTPSEENELKALRVSINKKPVYVGSELFSRLYRKENLSCIFTSATLSVADSFDFIKEELGIDLCEKHCEYSNPKPIKVNEFIGESPFNLTEQQLWFLHPDCVDGNSKEFDSIIPYIIKDIIGASAGGVLALFTSIKNMNDVYFKINKEMKNKGYTIMKQGEKPRIKLLEEFTENIDSTLFATKSFFTGVDVSGDALRCVIIDKLPFPSPADPIMIKLQEKPNSFFKYFIPMMIISLKQAVGRGVRSINDKCVIAILDNRLATARYKKKINNSFNYEKKGTRELSDITDFLGISY